MLLFLRAGITIGIIPIANNNNSDMMKSLCAPYTLFMLGHRFPGVWAEPGAGFIRAPHKSMKAHLDFTSGWSHWNFSSETSQVIHFLKTQC